MAAAEVAEAGAIGVEPGLSAAEKREWLRPQSHAARPAAARVGQRERRGPPCRATTMLGKRGGAFFRGKIGWGTSLECGFCSEPLKNIVFAQRH